jgi:hypothetical protein
VKIHCFRLSLVIFAAVTDADFKIEPLGAVSGEFIARGIRTFSSACDHVRTIPYGRNDDKTDILCVLGDNRGTCSTKHALLKELAIENNQHEAKLMVGIVRMSGENTPDVSDVLGRYKLPYIPEAHTYLKFRGKIIDCTKPSFPRDGSGKEILAETEIQPVQTGDYKLKYHRDYLLNWLREENVGYSPDEIWDIRELCIAALSGIRLV